MISTESLVRLDHDQLFKRLIETFFEPIMRLLFPEAAARLRFDEVEFLHQEYFTDHPTGKKQVMDVVARVGTLGEGPELILILGEIEYDRRSDFLTEMFDRFTLLRHRQKLPVFPIALYLTSPAHGRTVEEYNETVLGLRVLDFRFACVALPDLNGVAYREQENPVAPALAALMAHPGETRVEHKIHCLQELEGLEVTEAEAALLQMVVDTYLPLAPSEVEEFKAMIHPAVYEYKGQVLSPYAARELEETSRDILLEIIQARFGSVPALVEQRVRQSDAVWCRVMIKKAAVANSLSELEIA